MGGLWFAWGMRWRIGQWCHMMMRMGDGNYEVQRDEMSWGTWDL
jgi:hypothetical protein